MKTTLNKIRAHSPCKSGWTKLLKNLGKTGADDEPLAITTILDSNGLDDALWCLRAVDGCQKEMRLFAVDCARSVQHLMTDARCRPRCRTQAGAKAIKNNRQGTTNHSSSGVSDAD